MNEASDTSTSPDGDDALVFPEDFIWGCGTSPTQVEGETVNEWAGFIARDGTTPDDGPLHWKRYRKDFSFLGQLNVNAYRIGFDWGRLQRGPREPFDRETALRYLEMLAELRGFGIEPYMTVFHFACPVWLAEHGGWTNGEAPELFADFAGRLAELVDRECRVWITVNEPAVYAFMAYCMEEFPPKKRWSVADYLTVMKHLRTGHALARERIKAVDPDAQVGVTKHFKRFEPLRGWHPVDQTATFLAKRVFSESALDGFLRHEGEPVSDFVGVNYYGRMRMMGLTGLSPVGGSDVELLDAHCGERDDMWEQDPAWLPECLAEVAARSNLPLYVTECGVATEDEDLRERALLAHLRGCREALDRGVDLRGFFYWSLMDNYEWSEGLAKRFGLLSVDFADPDRRRDFRPAGRTFARVAGAGAVVPERRRPKRRSGRRRSRRGGRRRSRRKKSSSQQT